MLPIAPPRKYNDEILIVTALPIDEPSIADPPPAVPAPPPAAEAAAAPVEAAPVETAGGGGGVQCKIHVKFM